MFDRIAPRYDLLNRVLSAGTDIRWRRRAVDFLDLGPSSRVLDLCTGTADLLVEALGRDPAHAGLGVDLSHAMLRLGAAKLDRAGLARRARVVGGDAERLPVGDGLFDGALVAFGIRNVGDPRAALREVRRALRPGGRLVVLEFSLPKGLLGRPVPSLLHAGAAADRWPRQRRPLGLRLPSRVGGGLPEPVGIRRAHEGDRLRVGAVAAPDGRHRLSAPGGEAAVKSLASRLHPAAEWLRPRRDAIVTTGHGRWPRRGAPTRARSGRGARVRLDALIVRLSAGDVEGLLTEDARQAVSAARRGASALVPARAIRPLSVCVLPYLDGVARGDEPLETLAALDELGMRRVEALLDALEDESARRLVEAQEQEARARESQREGRGRTRPSAGPRRRAGTGPSRSGCWPRWRTASRRSGSPASSCSRPRRPSGPA